MNEEEKKQARRERDKKYREANREKRNEYNRNYRAEHKEAIQEYQSDYRYVKILEKQIGAKK